MNTPRERALLAAARIREETFGAFRCMTNADEKADDQSFDLYESGGSRVGRFDPTFDTLALSFGKAATPARLNALHQLLRGLQRYIADRDYPLCADCGVEAAGLNVFDCPRCQAKRAESGDKHRRNRPDTTKPRFTG